MTDTEHSRSAHHPVDEHTEAGKMARERREADTKLCLAVAKAAGIPVHQQMNGRVYRDRSSERGGELFDPLHPTLGWNDAMEAAKKVGLLHIDVENCVLIQHDDFWCVHDLRNPDKGNEVSRSDSGPRAICEAIVAVKGGE